MPDESEEALIPSIKRRTKAYSSLISGHQQYKTVLARVNSLDFWNTTVNHKLSKGWKMFTRYVRELLAFG